MSLGSDYQQFDFAADGKLINIGARMLQKLEATFVQVNRRTTSVPGRNLEKRFRDQHSHRVEVAGIGFETTPSTAAALARIGHLDFHVAQLAAVAMLAFHDHVANNDAAANAGAKRE